MINHENIFSLDFNINNKSIVIEEDLQKNIIEENVQQNIKRDLENARLEGFSAGYALGFEEGNMHGQLKAITKNQQITEDIFVKMYKDIESILKQEVIYDEKITDVILKISSAIIKKVLPHYINKYGANEMEFAIRYILSTLLDHQDITISISSVMFDHVYENIAEIQKSFPNKLTFTSDDSLKELESCVYWKGGGARWSQPDLLDNIQDIFESFLQTTDLDKEVSI
jgi:flagellar biosynthesis/type III secretory pathway protein FliH